MDIRIAGQYTPHHGATLDDLRWARDGVREDVRRSRGLTPYGFEQLVLVLAQYSQWITEAEQMQEGA